MSGHRRGLRFVHKGEAIGIAITAVVLVTLFHRFDAFERFSEFVNAHEDIQLDEIFLALGLTGIAALFITVRRALDLRSEIAQKTAAEERALRLARHDPLTGLPNRRVLGEDLTRMKLERDSTRRDFAVFLIDLDHFKPVNDLHGHDVGDELLVEVAKRLQSMTGGADRVYRLGGDEFVLVSPGDPGDGGFSRLASHIVRRLSEPMLIAGRAIRIGATVGVSRSPIDGTEPQDLLRGADIAMYEAKSAGRGKYRFFHAEMDQRFQERTELEADIRIALDSDQIVPYFQPIFDLGQERIVGFEALARWIHPTRGLIDPDHFIPIVEDLGLLNRLTERILRTGCAAAKQWPPDLTLSINVAPVQLQDAQLAASLLAVMKDVGFAPSRLIVEVTENAMISDTGRASEIFTTLQNAGVRTALDDFGKGYSSLSYLRQLHFDHIKIDRSFIHSMPSAESLSIVSAVAGLGRALGMRVIAEGVESPGVAVALLDLGCEQAQGYFFGRPMPAAETTEFASRTIQPLEPDRAGGARS